MAEEIKLQVMIAAYGKAGIESVTMLPHPEMEGVEYIVSWQYGDDEPEVPETLRNRHDFHVYPTPTRGVALNRNLALAKASAPIVMASDDDVSYTREQLLTVIREFENRPNCDFLAFKYYSSENPRSYPEKEFDLRRPPKGYFIGGVEMTFRLAPIRNNGIHFNELFGIGAIFPHGEEDLFLHDVIKAGLKGRFIPKIICGHESDSTGMREKNTPDFVRTKGAIHSILHPFTWPLRLLTHILREPSPTLAARKAYAHHWLQGISQLHSLPGK